MRTALMPLLLLAAACPAARTPTLAAVTARPPMSRLEFNQAAARLNLPLFWVRDADGDGVPDPDELTVLLFYPASDDWARPGKLAADLPAALAAMRQTELPAGLSAEEAERRRLVRLELDQAAPTLVRSDLRGLSDGEKRFVDHLLAAVRHIDDLFAVMTGARALEPRVLADDPASHSLFRRNWGPTCSAPRTAQEPRCNAIPGAPHLVSDLYPAALQNDPGFCKALEERKDAKALLDPFVVVRERAGVLRAMPYSEAYREPMAKVARELRAGADALREAKEAPLVAYLLAAAQGFESNDWAAADEAWARMNTSNSRWYVRVAPDETYWEPCAQKAGFHVTFALINQESLKWQEKLTPLQQGMEHRLAGLIGAPYVERKVSFHLPDFIDIVVNAGDDRDARSATIGQSLPNWGKVAEDGRGRTMATTNLYTDDDSLELQRKKAGSLLDAGSMAWYGGGTTPSLVGTILHEATHNLGPAGGYQADGKTSPEAFGGQLSSLLEELKAQSGALFFTGELVRAGVIDETLARQSWVEDLVFAFGHISRGMVSETGTPLPYSQLSAIQVGFLMDEGVLAFDPSARAANGSDTGAFVVHLEKLPAASEKLMKTVATIKATGARADAEALVKKYVEGDRVPRAVIAERFLRYPKQSFVYSIER